MTTRATPERDAVSRRADAGDRGYHCVTSLLISLPRRSEAPTPALIDLPDGFQILRGREDRGFVAYKSREPGAVLPAPRTAPVLLLGDDFEQVGATLGTPGANATVLRCDLEAHSLEAVVSVPGLPALYLFETDHATLVTSDPYLLRHVEGLRLRFSREGIAFMAQYGHPVAYRALFSGLRMLRGGARLRVSDGSVTEELAWVPPQRDPLPTWDDYSALQTEAFADAMAKLDVRSCEFSLSAGLDSRATLAGLIETGASVRALTVSGEARMCLDARTASKLCRAYGIEHQVIPLDEGFRKALPEIATQASLLSGGINSMGTVPQVHCYRVLGDPPPYNALSGYLGNQTGRRGTEGLTPRAADTSFLTPDLAHLGKIDGPLWYEHAMEPDGYLETGFLIQEENTFGMVASYQIGNTFSVQQSPYAYRPLIENMWRMPEPDPDASSGRHAQTLRHAFFGEPLEESFQRKYINRVGGLVASYPVNWGWRSRGGVSLPGMFWGGVALTDAIVSSRLAETPVNAVSKAIGVAGIHEWRPVQDWVYHDMKDFVYDEVLSSTSAQSGLFDMESLRRTVDQYYASGKGFKEIVLAMDLALAAKNYGATV